MRLGGSIKTAMASCLPVHPLISSSGPPSPPPPLKTHVTCSNEPLFGPFITYMPRTRREGGKAAMNGLMVVVVEMVAEDNDDNDGDGGGVC